MQVADGLPEAPNPIDAFSAFSALSFSVADRCVFLATDVLGARLFQRRPSLSWADLKRIVHFFQTEERSSAELSGARRCSELSAWTRPKLRSRCPGGRTEGGPTEACC